MIIYDNRAANILYNFLLSIEDKKRTFLIPSNVCPVIPLIFLKLNLKFEFCDIDDKTLCISKNVVLKKIKNKQNKYGGILFVRTYGIELDETEFFDFLKQLESSFVIIDDKCLCVPSLTEYNIIPDLVLYSTGYAKYVDLGYGGFAFHKGIILNNLNYQFQSSEDINQNYINQTKKLEVSSMNKCKFIYIDNNWLDFNIKFDFINYQNKILTEIKVENDHRSIINNIYRKQLTSVVSLDDSFQTWRYNILVKNKEVILRKIFENKLFASSHYRPLNVSFNNEVYKVSEKLYSEVINLFNNQKMNVEMAYEICDIINKYS